MRLARERAVPETKLTPTFLELLVELGGVELCWPDPYLRSPAPWVTWDFPMHLHCDLWSSAMLVQMAEVSLTEDFSIGLTSCCTPLLKLHCCTTAPLQRSSQWSSQWWSLRTKKWRGEVRASLHTGPPALVCRVSLLGAYTYCLLVFYS